MRPQRPGEVVRLDYQGIGEAMREDGVRDAAGKRARDIAANANVLARSAGMKVTFEVRESIRAGRVKRPEAQVRADTPNDVDRAHLLSLLQAAGRVV